MQTLNDPYHNYEKFKTACCNSVVKTSFARISKCRGASMKPAWSLKLSRWNRSSWWIPNLQKSLSSHNIEQIIQTYRNSRAIWSGIKGTTRERSVLPVSSDSAMFLCSRPPLLILSRLTMRSWLPRCVWTRLRRAAALRTLSRHLVVDSFKTTPNPCITTYLDIWRWEPTWRMFCTINFALLPVLCTVLGRSGQSRRSHLGPEPNWTPKELRKMCKLNFPKSKMYVKL